jgi:hypothetical protein
MWLFGASDWSFNEHQNGRYESHWQHHVYGFTTTKDPKKLKKRLQKQFPPTDAIPRPVQVKLWDGDEQALRYAFKPGFVRRIGKDTGNRYDQYRTRNRSCRDTDKQPLRSRQRKELLLHLDRIGFSGRLFLKGLQFQNLRGKGPTFVRRKAKP